MQIEQMLDTRLLVSRNPAFGVFTIRVHTRDGTDVDVVLDMESTIFVLENLDEGQEFFEEKKSTWFSRFAGRFKSKKER